jgi:isopentenyl diphosphate isomerase/L-lactate dehydrogenase-like FMN-dependent dehydrogenase
VISARARRRRVVASGRGALWGLAADGADGVCSAMTILRNELATALALGNTSVGPQLRRRLPRRLKA